MNNNPLYATIVALDVFRELRWTKTPGLDQITARFEQKGDNNFAAIVAAGSDEILSQSPHPADARKHNSITINDDTIVVKGPLIISFLVNSVGIDFNGADAYRGQDKSPS